MLLAKLGLSEAANWSIALKLLPQQQLPFESRFELWECFVNASNSRSWPHEKTERGTCSQDDDSVGKREACAL